MKRFLSFFALVCLSSYAFADKADLFIFSYDRPLQLDALLQSIEKHVTNLGQVVVIYRVSSPEFDKGYQQCFDEHKPLNLVLRKQGSLGKPPAEDFKYFVQRAILDSPNNYILFAVDDIIIQDSIDLDDCIQYLKKTKAHGFYLRLGENITQCYMLGNLKTPVPLHTVIDDKVLYWKFSDAAGDWNYPNTVDLMVCDKDEAYATIGNLHFASPNTLEFSWDQVGTNKGDRQKYGLCYKHSKMINVPYNKVMEDWEGNRYMGKSKEHFLDLYNKGNRMDIEQYAKVQNKSPHIEVPLFLKKQTIEKDLQGIYEYSKIFSMRNANNWFNFVAI